MLFNRFIRTIDVEPKERKTSNAQYHFRNALFIRILFGYYYLPVSTNRFISYLVKLYCLCISLSITAYVLTNVEDVTFLPYTIAAVEYALTVFISCFSNTSHRFTFLSNIDDLDNRLIVNRDEHYKKLKSLHNYIAVATLLARALYATTFCVCFKEVCWPLNIVVYSFIAIAIDVNQIPISIIFYMSNYQMKMLRQNVEKNTYVRPPTVYEKNENRKIRDDMEIYKDILDNIECVLTKFINPLFFISLVCSFPKIMLLLYNILVQSKNGVSIFSLIVQGVEAVQWACLPCLPGVVSESIASEVDNLKVILLQQLHDARDTKYREEIQEFIQYLELRPFKYTIWKIIPINMCLPIGLINLCTTYLIVVIQFTHLFG